MLEKIKGVFQTKCKKALCILLSIAVLSSMLMITASATVTTDANGMKITLSYKPGCLQIDGNGKIYVGDWDNGYLYRYNADGSLDTSWGSSGKATGVNIGGTVGMCLDNTENIIITGQWVNTVYKVNKDTGAVIKTIFVSGPLGCTTDSNGNIYIAAHSGIYKYDSNFNLLKSDATKQNVFGIAVNSDGKIYYTTNYQNQVFRLNSDFSVDTTFGTNGSVVVFKNSYGDNLLIQGGKLYTSSEFDNACYSLNLDGTNIQNIISGTGPTQVFITGNSYAVPFWGGQYIQIFQRPNIDVSDNFKFTMNPLKVTEGSATPITFKIESTSDKNYTVKAQLIDKQTKAVVSGVNSTTATLQGGGANVVLTPTSGGWKKGIYGIQMIFSNTVGAITLSDTLEVGISMGVGYYAVNYNTPANGTIVSKTEYVEMGKDAPATFTVSPDAGYSLDKIGTTVSNGDLEYNGNQVTIKNITADVNVNVAFTEASAISDITGVPDSWTNQDQTVSFTANGDVASVEVSGSVSGSKTVTNSGSIYSFEATQNETYTVTVTNSAGKKNTTPIEVSKIDKTTPVLSVSHTPEDLSQATESDVVFTLSNTATNPSGVTYYVQKDNGTFEPVSGSTFAVSAPDSSTYHFKAVSGAGSQSAISSGYTVNAIKPVFIPISVDTNGYSAGGWTSGNVTLSLSGGLDASAFAKYQYSTNTADWNDVTGTSVTVDSNFNGSYYFRAVAKSGSTGSTTEGTSVKVDKDTGFSITASGNTTSICQNDTVTLGITGIGASGIAKVEVQKDNGDWTDITSSYQDGYKVTANGSYLFKVTNGAGVEAVSTTQLVYDKIDTAVPTVSLSASGYMENTWTTGNVTVDITNGNAANLGNATCQYSTDNGTTYIPFDGKLLIANDTNTTYLFKVISQSGVESESLPFTIKRDATAPTGTVTIGKNSWKEFLNTITFGLFCKDTATVTVTGADVTSGIRKVEYCKSATALTLDQVKAVTSWTDYKTALSETPVNAKSFIYYIKLTDNAGNVGYISSDAVTFDTTLPTIDGITNGATYYVDQTVTASDTNLDTITVNGSPFENGSKLPADTNAAYEIVASDKAGNSVTYTVYTKAISSIDDSIQGLTVSNVTTSDKAAIEAVLATVSEAMNTTKNGAAQDQINALNAIKDNAAQLLDKIADVVNAITDVTDKTNGITPDNAKSSDKTNLDSALSTVNDLLQNKYGNLTDSEKAGLEQKKTDIQNALSKIADVANAIADVTDKTNGTTPDNAKSSDKANLDSALSTVNDLLQNKSGNLTDSEKAALEQKKTDVQNALEIINTLAERISDADKLTKDITKDNVKKDDQTNLKKAAEELNKILDNNKNNLTDDEKNNINDQIKNIQDISGSLDQVKTVEDQISKLPDADTVTRADTDAINDANKAFDDLSDHQETLVDPGAVTKLKDVTEALSKLLLEDPATGTKVEGVDGTTFDVNTELVVTPIKDTLDASTKQLFAVGVANAAEGQEIAQLYDIHLLLNGQKIQPDGKVKITLKLTEAMKNYTDLQVVYIADDGKVTILPHEQNGDEITFYTDHFSNYGIIGTPVNSNSTGNSGAANTGETTPFIPYAIAGAAALSLMFAAKKKRGYKFVLKK